MARQKETRYENENPVSVFLTRALEDSEKTQAQVAKEMGLAKGNVMTMFKQGLSPMPIRHIPSFCESTNSDVIELMTLALREYHPAMYQTFKDLGVEAMAQIFSEELVPPVLATSELEVTNEAQNY